MGSLVVQDNSFEEHNFVGLSPISFLERAAFVYGDKPSILYGDHTKFVWRETHQRCLKLASALVQMGVNRGDIVAAVAPNVPALYELHFGVPMAGAILSALNPNLDAPTLSSLLQDLAPKIIFIDHKYVDLVLNSLNLITVSRDKSQTLVIIQECASSSFITKSLLDSLRYDQLLAMGKDDFHTILPINECDPISVNFTSGSTGKPKGVVYSHRAAYLNSIAVIHRYDMRSMPVFLWTVDMFRCNGWCFTWVMAAIGGTNICIRSVTSKLILDSVSFHNVTHIFGPPKILNIISDSHSNHHHKALLTHKANIVVAGALPPSHVIKKVEDFGFSISHAYGMTEALGPIIVTSLQRDKKTSEYREGIYDLMMEGVDVKEPTMMTSVPSDGKTIGEIMFKSNAIMTGYFKNPKATQEAFREGWYKTRDIGVRHENGHIEIKDRRVDAIYNSRGEYISTIEVEAVLTSHPMVVAAAVVGRQSGSLGETTPCAFVKLKEGNVASEQEIIEFCRERLLVEYMIPKRVVFGDLPVNSTGKIQKFVLRERARALGWVAHSNRH